jgi:hypothetical protein
LQWDIKRDAFILLIFNSALEYPIGETAEVPEELELSSLNLVILVYADDV